MAEIETIENDVEDLKKQIWHFSKEIESISQDSQIEGLQEAIQNAANAVSTANQAMQKANAVEVVSNTANQTANNASQTATNASTVANQANQTASTAQSNSSTALTNSQNALSIAQQALQQATSGTGSVVKDTSNNILANAKFSGQNGIDVQMSSNDSEMFVISIKNSFTQNFLTTNTVQTISAAKNFTSMPKYNDCVLFESGSNSNGKYFKFADGTMICCGTKGRTSSGAGAETVTLPQAFIAAPIVACGWMSNASSTTSFYGFIIPNTLSTTGFQVRTYKDATAQYIAFGKWK